MRTSRRNFLRLSVGASASGWLKVNSQLTVAQAVPSWEDTVVVVVELSGGNDGLNCVVPYADDEYYRQRPSIGIPANRVHRINDQLGFHPDLKEFGRLLDQGELSIVQGVGYPEPSGDHEVSLRYWQTARPHDASCQTGWLGRVVDSMQSFPATTIPAAFVGPSQRPLTLNAAQSVVPSLQQLEQWCLPSDDGDPPRAAPPSQAPHEIASLGPDSPLLDSLRRNGKAAAGISQSIREIAAQRAQESSVRYPACQLATTLDTVAQLIRADLGIRIFCADLGGDGFGGFDNHANQLGNHGALLKQLATSVAAFVDDLRRDGLLDRVLLLTFSEFGRTVAENGRRGTDHGSAAPVFLAGGRLRPGLVGTSPALTELEGGGLKFHTDFRQVYATVLDQWLGVDSATCLGDSFPHIDLFAT